MRDDQYAIYMIRYARADRRRPENFLDGDPHDGPMPIDFFNWVVTNHKRTFVVDTGFDAVMAGRRNRTILMPVEAGLRAVGVDRDRATEVIITHLHYDHAGNHDLLPTARYHLQACEMEFATGPCMCHALLRRPFEADDVVAMVRKVFAGRVQFHDGDCDIAPGVSLHAIGGHSRGLQAVRVNTERGPVVLASDAAHYYEHVECDRIFPIFESVAGVLEGYRKLRRLAPSLQHVVPGHDPKVFERYPAAAQMGGWAVRVDLPPSA